MIGTEARSTCPHTGWESDAFHNGSPVGRVCLDCGTSQQWYALPGEWGPVIRSATWILRDQPLPFPEPDPSTEVQS